MGTERDIDGYLTLVSITKTVSVLPKVLHPPKLLTLSNLDRQSPIHMYLVFFYNSNSVAHHKDNDLLLDGADDSVFGSLKCGLEETLSVWYPAAGRLSLNPSDHGNKFNLWCNNKGAVLVEAETPVNVSELGDLSQYKEFFEKLVHKPVFDGDFSETPLVVGQVTKFGCGGYSVGIGISHSLFDGPAAYEFMSAWASNSTKTKKQHKVSEIPNLPVHDRETLLMDKFDEAPKGISTDLLPNQNEDGSPGVTRAAAVGHLYQLIIQAAASNDHMNFLKNGSNILDQINDRNYVYKTFHLRGTLIESLKKEVCGDETTSFRCSSFEVVAAHLWKAKTKALGVKKEAMVCLQFSVDARNKVDPVLPQGFSGNAFVLASVALTAAQVEEATHKAIVEKIRVAKNSVTNSYVKAYMEAVGGPQTTLPPLEELTLVSDWTRMPFHKIGFLHESAAYASPLVSSISQVAYFMQNPSDCKGIDMRVGLLPQYVSAFSRCFIAND
ncbi:unnamed protein product [Malus baccata var. baccata]